MTQYWILLLIIGSISCYRHDDHMLTNGKFSTDFFNHILDTPLTHGNLVFSPVSIHNILGLTFLGSEGTTATELENVLHLPSISKEKLAINFFTIFELFPGQISLVQMANKIYVKDDLKISPSFNKIAQESFDSVCENINFEKTNVAVRTINDWVEHKTNNKIKNLMTTVDPNSEIIFVTAIHFKGEWNFHPKVVTREFLNEGINGKQTEFITAQQNFKLAELTKLDAVAAEFPYKKSNLHLMIILPNNEINLDILETKLKDINLLDLSKEMTDGETEIFVPKFKIETTLETNEILKSMGLKSIFNNAEINFLEPKNNLAVGNILTKVFIDVNEKGTEAAAATVTNFKRTGFLSFKPKHIRKFDVNRPFIFVIKDERSVYFAGHVRHL